MRLAWRDCKGNNRAMGAVRVPNEIRAGTQFSAGEEDRRTSGQASGKKGPF